MYKVVVGITTLNNPEILNNCLKSIYKTKEKLTLVGTTQVVFQ